MIYFWLKLIHILSSTLLFGTGLGTAFFMLRAHLSGSTETIAKTTRTVVLADWIFTTPSVIIQPLTGIALIYYMHYPWFSLWIILSIILFIFAGFCWLPVVYLQIKMHKLAQEAFLNQKNIINNKVYQKYFKIWFILGWPAFIAVMIIFYLMVFKPTL